MGWLHGAGTLPAQAHHGRLVTAPSALESEHAMNTARWRCLLCASDGIGGLKSWGVHYMNTHYLAPDPTHRPTHTNTPTKGKAIV